MAAVVVVLHRGGPEAVLRRWVFHKLFKYE